MTSHADSSPHPSLPITVGEYVLAGVAAVLLVTVLDLLTNSTPPRFDGVRYFDMARLGILGNDGLLAPFAYRPGMPLLARGVSDAWSITLEAGFLWVARAAAAAFLFVSFVLARRFTDSTGRAWTAVLLTGAYAMHVKFPLFFPTLVDVAAYPLIVLAVWAYVSGRPWLCFWVSAVGLFFKEFLAIPLLLTLGHFAVTCWKRADRLQFLTLGGALAVAIGVILIPRLALPVVDSYQEIDPLHRADTLTRLFLNPFDLKRNVNIFLGLLAYWLPFCLLITRERYHSLRGALLPWRRFVLTFLALQLLLVMYGGTNIMIFVAYGVPIQLMALAVIGRGAHPLELGSAVACVLAYNRFFSHIPLPDHDFEAYIDFYGLWSSRVNRATLFRFLEICAYVLALWTVRSGLRRHGWAAHGGTKRRRRTG